MAGDEADFDEFYRGSARDVVHVVYAATGDLTLAQDSAQEAFARAWQRWESVGTYDDPRAWVRTVARRLAVSSWRKRTNERTAHVRHGAPPPSRAPNEDSVAVVTALRALSPVVREAVALYYFADRSIDQIATETHAPAGTVKARLHRGRAQLAAALSTEESRHG